MALEIEAKLKVDSHEAVRAQLHALGGQRQGAVLETNRIFDNRGRTLLAGDAGLRFRTWRSEGRGTGDLPPPAGSPVGGARTPRSEEDSRPSQEGTLTFKGPQRPGTLKSREEIEVTVSPAERGLELLEALGFVEVVRFEKRRETWRLEDCGVELDEVPHLGTYVEIEGPDEPAVRRVQSLLQLSGLPHIRKSYIALLTDHCRRHGLPSTVITFAEENSTGDHDNK